jgi:hypothetical protein
MILTISSEVRGSGLTIADAHMIRLDQTVAAAGLIPEQKLSVYQVIIAPRNTVTVANLNDACGTVLALTNTVANLAKIYNSEP